MWPLSTLWRGWMHIAKNGDRVHLKRAVLLIWSAAVQILPHDLTLDCVFDILSVRFLAIISISVGIYEYLFSERKGFG